MVLPLFDSRHTILYFGLTEDGCGLHMLGSSKNAPETRISLNVDKAFKEVRPHVGDQITFPLDCVIKDSEILKRLLKSPVKYVFAHPVIDESVFNKTLGFDNSSKMKRLRLIQKLNVDKCLGKEFVYERPDIICRL